MAEEAVKFELKDGVATITLNRPERLNAWNEPLVRQLISSIEAAAADEVRVVVITGAGRAFSSGADLKEIGSILEGADSRKPQLPSDILKNLYHPMLTAITELEKPVVAAINGPAAGIGLSLALVCDLLVAKESAVLMLPFAAIGLMPDGGSPILIPASIGRVRAMELALLGEPVPAKEAHEMGLITRVVSDDSFEQELTALTEKLASGATLAYAAAKKAINQATLPRLQAALGLEAELQDHCAASEDFAEGLQAFLQKRKPEFIGR